MKAGKETFPACVLRWEELKKRNRAECYVILLTFVRPFGLIWFKFLLYILILSVSIAVAQEYVASNDAENEINL